MELNPLARQPLTATRERPPQQPVAPPVQAPVDQFSPAPEGLPFLAPRPFYQPRGPYPDPGLSPDPRTRQNDSIPPGSLIILDNGFRQGVRGEDHGAAVTRAARVAGFNGQIRQVTNEETYNFAPVGIPAINPERARTAFRDYARQEVLTMLDSTGRTLDGFTRDGVRNSALNISSGFSQSDLVRSLDNLIRNNPRVAANAALGFGVSLDRLNSRDPEVARAERQRLVQGLVDNTRGLSDDRVVRDARQRYDESVRRFESNHNSVVVATTNSNGDTDGIPGVRYPEDFHRSLNINDQMTAVSSRPTDGRPASPVDAPNAIYANGRVMHRHAPRLPFNSPFEDNFTPGTSFATPQVAALTAEIHRQNPSLSSAQVETLLRNRFTQPQENRTDLNDRAAYEYMRRQTY